MLVAGHPLLNNFSTYVSQVLQLLIQSNDFVFIDVSPTTLINNRAANLLSAEFILKLGERDVLRLLALRLCLFLDLL
jgi:hypothetical protein